MSQILQKRYGMSFVSFCNEESAINTLKAVRIASKNKQPLPQNIISSSHILQPFNMQNKDNSISVLLKPQSAYDEFNKLTIKKIEKLSGQKYPQVITLIDKIATSSTNNSIGIYLHEILHTGMQNRRNYGTEFVGAVHNNTLCKLSDYLKNRYFQEQGKILKEEARVELETKRILERLKPKEEIVLNAIC